MAESLPTVEEEFTANTRPFIDAVMEAAAAVRDLAEDVIELQAEIDALHGKDVTIGLNVTGLGDTAGLAALSDEVNAVRESLDHMAAESAADSAVMIAALNRAGDAATETAAKMAVAGAAGGAAAWAPAVGWIRLTGTALHWIVAGAAEFLAVAVPAAIALGAGMAVAAQGAQNAYNHFEALYNTLEAVGPAFHQTVGSVLGLHSALQQAQNAANPGVYEIVGSAINDLKGNFQDLAGVGLQVVHMFDEFAARVTVDLHQGMGTEIQGLLAGMVTDLQEFGNVLGNLGHALLNFAAAMPGLAHALLDIAVGISDVVEWASRAGPLLTFGMALEEMYRWGGLALNMLVKLTGQTAALNALGSGGFIFKFGAALQTMIGVGGAVLSWAGQMISKFSAMIGVSEEAGAAIDAFGFDVQIAAATMSPLMVAGIAAGAGALIFLVAKLASAKDATQQWVAATQQAVQSASDLNVMNLVSQKLAENTTRLASAQETLNRQYANSTGVSGVASRYTGQYSAVTLQASQDVRALSQNQQFLYNTGTQVMANTAALAHALGISMPSAMEAAQMAGVKLQSSMAKGSEAFKIAVQQIRNLQTSLGAMQAPAGQVGADFEAMGIQTQLAGTKIQQLNQAWDQWVSSVNSGLSTMAGAVSAVEQLGGKTYTLAGYGKDAMTSFSNFTQAISQGETAIDTLRTGLAEGVVSAGQFGTTIRGLVGYMAPFTQGNKAAVEALSQLAHEAGGPTTTSLKQLEQWAGVAGRTARDQFAKGMEQATIQMGDMAKVAANLSVTVSTDLNSQFAKAAVQASGLASNLTNLANAMANPSTSAATLHGDLNDVIVSMLRMHQSIPTITADLNGMGINITEAGVKALISAAHLGTMAQQEANVGSRAAGAAGPVDSLAAAINALHSKSISLTVTTYYQSVGMANRGGHTGTGPGYASGTDYATPGLHVVGERGPEIVAFAGGERVFTAPDTSRILAGGGGIPGSGPLETHIHNHVYLDGQQIFEAVKTQTANYNVRNGNPQQGRLAPG